MKVEFISPFIEASIKAMQETVQLTPTRGQLSARPQVFTTQQVNIVCGVTGAIDGQVIYGMSIISADKIASIMLGSTVVTFDQVAAAAIADLGAKMAEHSIELLKQQGFECRITPPTIVKGSNVKISTLDVPALVIPLEVEGIGEIEINVSVQAGNVPATAAA